MADINMYISPQHSLKHWRVNRFVFDKFESQSQLPLDEVDQYRNANQELKILRSQ
ncbi:hypothetical protein SFRURICE_005099 [Spodoptera frugiperda]|nr:hypothetical protein SFRURICE_005099 [Spodoptera frugiperda]